MGSGTDQYNGPPAHSLAADPSRPKKSLIACSFCKEKKMRCDEGRPQCANCAKRGRACVYAPAVRRRGPGRKNLAAAAAQAASCARVVPRAGESNATVFPVSRPNPSVPRVSGAQGLFDDEDASDEEISDDESEYVPSSDEEEVEESDEGEMTIRPTTLKREVPDETMTLTSASVGRIIADDPVAGQYPYIAAPAAPVAAGNNVSAAPSLTQQQMLTTFMNFGHVNLSFMVNQKPHLILETIGKGGSSTVGRARTIHGHEVALKMVDLTQADDKLKSAYRREIEFLRRLEGNAHIVRLLDAEIQGDLTVLVLELGEKDLARLLAERMQEPFEMTEVLSLWGQMLRAVEVLHGEKIVHSDLKPANFVLVKGCLKLIDFGIAKSIPNDTTSIHDGHIAGTVNYMSPEAVKVAFYQDHTARVGRQSDVWSLGCILYQMVHGKAPFATLDRVLARTQAIVSPTYEIPFWREDARLVDTIADSTRRESRLSGLYSAMQRCLRRTAKERPTVPELVLEFLRLSASNSPTNVSTAVVQAALAELASRNGVIDLQQLNMKLATMI